MHYSKTFSKKKNKFISMHVKITKLLVPVQNDKNITLIDVHYLKIINTMKNNLISL
jgi:hypothetical protein